MCSACKTNLVLKLELKQSVGEDMQLTRENVEYVVRCFKFELLEESKVNCFPAAQLLSVPLSLRLYVEEKRGKSFHVI